MKRWTMKLLVAGLALTLFGCGSLGTTSGGSRDAKLALPACPPDQVTLEFGWIGPKAGAGADGRVHQIFGITSDDRLVYESWVDKWRRCAWERGVVIEEANK